MKNYKYKLLLIILTSYCNLVQSQIFSVGPSGLTISAGTIFSADSLALTPSTDFEFRDVSLFKSDRLNHTPINPCISRVYRFSTTTDLYQGTVQIHYLPGELNSINEQDLRVCVYSGTVWYQVSSAVIDETNHYVISGIFPVEAMSEVTLGNPSSILPLTWLSFNATKKSNGDVLLEWATGHEQNTRDFTVQHSADGIRWSDLTTVPKSTVNNVVRNYNAVHATPLKNLNYYRILQTDLNGRKNYSDVRTVNFNTGNSSFYVLDNPVISRSLQIMVTGQMTLSLYSGEGRLIWHKNVDTGIQSFDVAGHAKGIYYLKGNNVTIKLLIQ